MKLARSSNFWNKRITKREWSTLSRVGSNPALMSLRRSAANSRWSHALERRGKMNTAAYVIIAAIVATGLYFCIRWLARSFSKFGGSRPVTCPENGKRILVEVDARHAAMTSALGRPDIRLQNCSRWPLKQDCGQECLVNLDVAPDDCLVSGVLMRWYEGKTCVSCRKKFEAVHWMDHRPALRTPEGTLIEWGEVTVEDMPTVLETHF